MRPKVHAFDHLLRDALRFRLNPRHIATWNEESYMGCVKRATKTCHGSTVLRTSLVRYLLYLCLRWHQRRATGLWALPV
eukprot:1070275-Alexandrium_andersonii.AAC.1